MENEFERTIIDRLNDLHIELVGSEDHIKLTDFDKIVGILEVLAEKVEKQEDHSHSIS